MQKKKIIALILGALMVTSLFVGCGKKDQPNKGGNANDKPAVEEGNETADGELFFPELPNNTLSVSINVPNFGTSPADTLIQNEWQKRMEEYLGVTLDISWNLTPWMDYRDNEKILLQSADIPDVATYSQGDYVNEYGGDGVVLDILKYKDYLTYYPEYVKETNGGEAFAYNEDGTAYYFMDGFDNPDDITGAQSFTAFAYRFDILKQLGLKPATTTEEFAQLCADLKAAIDAGDIDAKYVMTNQDKNYPFYRGFVGIFHTWDTVYWNGNEWSFGPIEDNFREMLGYMNGLYEAGYIDPEFATDDGAVCSEKAINGNHALVPTLWAGMARDWNMKKVDDNREWGLAFLPENSDYGRPWKWGSKQDGKSLQKTMGIIISAATEYPEYVVKMIDYQYSPEMVELLNWGIKDQTYTVDASGDHTFSEDILNAEDPVQAAGDYGITSSGIARTGIPFTPITFEAMSEQIPGEPWWNPTDEYYEGKYWIESGKIGGLDSVSPYDRPPVTRLTDEESTAKAELTTNCETYARENALKFITGEWDVTSDDAWNNYVNGVKTQVSDFDGTMEMMLETSDLDSIK
ncbi:MAG TPA: hypothetical protein GX707_18040 [Epulopiscium sp.]|nr:hypothetical protein [Candidatus Epulonipiscium sp.]